MKYCRAADQWHRLLAECQEKTKSLKELMGKGARSTRIKSALPDIQDLKEQLEGTLNQQKSCLKPTHQSFVKPKDEELEKITLLIEQMTQECLSNVEPLNPYEEETSSGFYPNVVEDCNDQTSVANPEEPLEQKDKASVSDTLDRNLKLLKDFNQSLDDNSTSFLRRRTTSSAMFNRENRRSLVDFSPLRKGDISEKYRQTVTASKIGSEANNSRTSGMSEKKRLELQAKILEQESQMKIEKRKRELAMEMERKELEANRRLEEMRAEAEIAELESEKALKQQQMRLQIEEAEGSVRPSSLCPSLMSLSLKEDKDSDIKSWLNQAKGDSHDEIKHQPRTTDRITQNPVVPKANVTSPMRKKGVSNHLNGNLNGIPQLWHLHQGLAISIQNVDSKILLLNLRVRRSCLRLLFNNLYK